VALEGKDPWLRRRCLEVLDHVANDASTEIFAAALRDPVGPVRASAIHGLTCERCRSAELCVADVAPLVIAAYEAEPESELRHKLLRVLYDLALRSRAAGEMLSRVADHDSDGLCREAAVSLLKAGHVRSRRALERQAETARRHSSTTIP